MLGHKHSEKIRAIYKLAAVNRVMSTQGKMSMIDAAKKRVGILNHFYGQKHSAETKNIIRAKVLNREKYLGPKVSVTIIDTITNYTNNYDTIKDAALALNTASGTLASRKLRNTTNLYRDRYHIIFPKKEDS